MKTVGSYEAKAHLSEILDDVANGAVYTITKHKLPIAILKPVRSADRESIEESISLLKNFRKGKKIGGSQALKEMGRK